MAKSIMIQGTMSNVGKSIITAGICRIFSQDGYKTAPFKSQNMALNSFITPGGYEIGRAQAMQAECCNKNADVRMNPILLKPTNDYGSQVIVNGEPFKNMTASEYFKFKTKLIPEIMASYNSLAKENDIIVIEGAGSPAEINLKENDIVNMGLAEMTKSPVILAGDIDRGGIFASLYGTAELVSKKEKNYIKALIINKFRGNIDILKPGMDMLYNLMKIPIMGVIPYFNIDIDDEDSLSERLNYNDYSGCINIVVVKLPRMSNFTDFNPLQNIDGINLIYSSDYRDIEKADLIIIPGSKNTIEDFLWLKKKGFESAILKAVNKDIPLIGICGGFQMLGKVLKDSINIENGLEVNGMGLLDIETEFSDEKIKRQVKGKFNNLNGFFQVLSNIEFEGYEIHMGNSRIINDAKKALNVYGFESECLGLYNKNIFGTYVHGIFDKKDVVKNLIEVIGKNKHIDFNNINITDRNEYKQIQYDKLADIIRKNLDIDMLYNILEKGV